MHTLTLAPTAGLSRIIRCRPARVYVDGRRSRHLKAVSWEVLPAPQFGRAVLLLHPSELSPVQGRIEDIVTLPEIGTGILIRPADGTGGAEFHGIITGHRAEATGRSETVIADADQALAVLLSDKLLGRWQWADGQAVWTAEAPVVFNKDQTALASATTLSIDGRQARLFDTSVAAQSWSVADAIAYLLAAAVPQDIEAPTAGELESLAGDIELAPLDVTGKSVAEALAEVAGHGGLELRPSREGLGLVFYRPGRQGRLCSVRLQCAGETLRPTESNLWHGRMALRRRSSRPTIVAIGAHKRYESTFLLKAGWDPALQSSRWRDFVRSESSNWPELANVYRKWVLNEHGWYGGSPWQLDLYDFSSISAEDFVVRVPRRFMDCLSVDETGRSLGVVVEYRCDSGADWRPWPLPVWAPHDECAVYLGGDGLPGEFFEAASQGTAEVRVTATVKADARLTVRIPGTPAGGHKLLHCSTIAGWGKVHAGSVFYHSSSLPAPNECDDTSLLAALAQRHAEAVTSATEAELTLGWVDTSYFVGDLIERIDGRGSHLAGDGDFKPSVRAVKHYFDERQQTLLIVSG